MRFIKHPILISLVLFAAVAYVPASHLVARGAASNGACPSDVSINTQ